MENINEKLGILRMKTLLSVEILVVDAFNFASCLERRALKLSSNETVFQEILKIFNSQLNQEFIKHNQKTLGKMHPIV